jgi:Ca2+-binding EF-hand superfamily protein
MTARIWLTTAVITAATAIAVSDESDTTEQPRLLVPARVLRPAPAPEADDDSEPEAAMTDTATEDMSGGVSPQYQSRRIPQPRVAPEEPYVRFVLPLPGQPVLVEASLTIDGLPFRMIREQRVGQILAELAKPPEVDVVNPEVAETTTTGVESTEDAASDSPAETKPAEETDVTAGADSPDEAEEPAETDPAAEEASESEEDAPPSAPPRDNSITGRLRRYAAATRRTPTRDEVRWLLTNWADGPTLLLLNENFQRIRGRQMPVFKILDRDEDGVLSDVELAQVQATLLRYDRDQNDLLSFAEIAAAADRTPDPTKVARVPPPMIPLADLANPQAWQRLIECYSTNDVDGNQQWQARFDADGSGSIDESELARLQTMDSDIRLDVAFDSNNAADSEIEVVDIVSSLGQVSAEIRGGAVLLQISGTLVEFSAVQMETGSGSDQVSMGAVRDGYPMLPELDLNNDGRLTLRELWHVPELLSAFDGDQDGQITHGELPQTLRVSFGYGPTVHEHLATVRSVHPPASGPKVTPPDWFVRSDVNADGDLTVREFLGNKEQFAKLDFDGDGLLSAAEAARSEKEKAESKTVPVKPPDEKPTTD